MLGPTAAVSSTASTASSPAGPLAMRLEICSMCTIESQEYTRENEYGSYASLDAFEEDLRKTDDPDFDVTTAAEISSTLDTLTFPRRRDESWYKQHVLNQLDSLAHYLEVVRLEILGVLRRFTELPQDCAPRHPSTRLVRPRRATTEE